MKKQEVAKEIFRNLGIKPNENDFSEGSTITKNALVKILTKIAKKAQDDEKQKIFEAIWVLLGQDINDAAQYFSRGSTITKKGYEEILKILNEQQS